MPDVHQMIFNLVDLGIQPSEIESMGFQRMTFYNDCHKVRSKAYRDAAKKKPGG